MSVMNDPTPRNISGTCYFMKIAYNFDVLYSIRQRQNSDHKKRYIKRMHRQWQYSPEALIIHFSDNSAVDFFFKVLFILLKLNVSLTDTGKLYLI